MSPRLAVLLLPTLLILACAESEPTHTTPALSPGASATAQSVLPARAATAPPIPTPTPLAGLILTPTPGPPADLATALRLEAEGELARAAAAYIAAANANQALRNDATLAAARVLLEIDRPADVQLLLEPYIASPGANEAARYLLARAYAALGLWQQSVEQYDAYIASGRPAQAYAMLDRIGGQLELGQTDAAIAAARQGLTLNLPSLRRSFVLSLAQANERAGNLTEALRWYTRLLDESPLSGDDALALSRIIAIKREQADPTYTEDLRRLLAEYPSTSQALSELKDALARGETVQPSLRGLVYYRNFDYSSAEPAFREQIEAAPESPASAEAYYYHAAILESRGELDEALRGYERTAELNAGGTLADDALWWRARILQSEDRLDEARATLDRLVTEYPASSWAREAAFRRGMLLYADKDYRGAAALWASSQAVTSDPAERERFTFWQAKALLRAGDRDAAKPLLEQLATESEDDYYGIRARGLLDDEHGIPDADRESRVDLSGNFDWAQAETWLSQKTGRPIVDPGWSADPRWLRAQELWLVGRTSQGDAEVFDLIEERASDPIAMYTLARALQAQGRVSMAARAGQRLLRVLAINPSQGLPKALLALAYPPSFGEMVQKHAAEARISPLLLLAFVRQESFFDPRAESPVGALGLTQVLPSTGRTIAARLGHQPFEDSDLLRADINLRFGATYMAQQLDRFDDEVFVALAAYNAGPAPAERWREQSGDDADLYLETIEFTETRLYVQLVAENYAIYRYLYAGQEHPSLPD